MCLRRAELAGHGRSDPAGLLPLQELSAHQRRRACRLPVLSRGDDRDTGERRVYTRPGGSGRPASRFACPICNAVVYGTGEVMPGLINIYAGSLDDSARFKPTLAIFVSERPPWDDVSRNLTCYATVPGG